MNEKEILALEDFRRDDGARLQGAGSDAARRSAVYAFLWRDRYQSDLAAVDAVGQDQVQKRPLHGPQGAGYRRGRAHHGARHDRGRDRRPATQPEALVPQRLGEDAPGLEVRRLAIDPARGLSKGLGRARGGHFVQEERTWRQAKPISWFERRCRMSASARNSINGMERTICLWRWISSMPRKAGASGAAATHRSTMRSTSSKTWQRCATVSTPRLSRCLLPTSIRHGPE